jgi:beta-lactamase class A
VLAVITKNQADTSYVADNEGHRLIRAVTRAAYEHFNPDAAWCPSAARPVPGSRRCR